MIIDISFIIVYYKAPAMLLDCIKSIMDDCAGYAVEFIIIDNSSDVPESELKLLNFPCRIFKQGYNSGFSRAINVGLIKAKGEYVFLVNQDITFFEKDTVKRLVEKAKGLPLNTVLGCRNVDENFGYQQSIWIDEPGLEREWRHSTFNYILNANWKKDFDKKLKTLHEKSGFVHRLNGAFLLFHRSLIDIGNLFWDEDFFLYGEDIEWALRCKKNNFQFFYFYEVAVKHLGSSSTSNHIIKNLQVLLSDFLFVTKSKGRIRFLFTMVLMCSIWVFDLTMICFEKTRGRKPDEDMKLNRQMKLWLIKNFCIPLLANHKALRWPHLKFVINEKKVPVFSVPK